MTKARGPAEFLGRPGFVTVHPAYLLRLPDEVAKASAWHDFISDLRAIRTLAEGRATQPLHRRAG